MEPCSRITLHFPHKKIKSFLIRYKCRIQNHCALNHEFAILENLMFLFLFPDVVVFVSPRLSFLILLYLFLFQRALALLHFLGSECSGVVVLPNVYTKA